MSKKGKDEEAGGAAAAAIAEPATQGQGGSPVDIRMIPLADLVESPLNKRSVWGDLESLAASIQSVGLMQPIVVRPLDGRVSAANPAAKFEIIAGARRFRASGIAGLTEIRASIWHVDDGDVIAMQLTENGNRNKPHALDEADLLATAIARGYGVKWLAARSGRDASYVYRRLQLNHLIDLFKEMFRQGRIVLEHALDIARLHEADQQDLANSELFRNPDAIVTPARLRGYIEQTYMLDLAAVLFPKDDPDLVKTAGPCTSCSKRTGFNKLLWPEISTRDTCTDTGCFAAKVGAYADRRQVQLQRRGKQAVKVSSHYRSGEGDSVVLPRGAYEEITEEQAAALPAAEVATAIATDGDTPGREFLVHVPAGAAEPETPQPEPADPEQAAEDRQKQQQKARRQEAINTAVFTAIANKAKALRPADWKWIAEGIWKDLSTKAQDVICEFYGWADSHERPGTALPFDECDWPGSSWQKLCLLLVLAEDVPVYDGGNLPDNLKDAAKDFGVDVAAARKQGLEEFKAAEKAEREGTEPAGDDEAKAAGKGREKKGST